MPSSDPNIGRSNLSWFRGCGALRRERPRIRVCAAIARHANLHVDRGPTVLAGSTPYLGGARQTKRLQKLKDSANSASKPRQIELDILAYRIQ